MTIRSRALEWLGERRLAGGHVVTSKRYAPHESWTKAKAWWLQVPLAAVQAGKTIEILCEADSSRIEFHHLRVPASFFAQQMASFALIGGEKINLFLAIDVGIEFQDQRGPGRVSFAKFKMRAPAA